MKKLLSVMAIIAMLAESLFAFSGCGKEENKDGNNGDAKAADTTQVSYTSGKLTYTVSVPKKDDDSAKYEFTKDKPEAAKNTGSFYLETDNVVMSFSSSGLVYTTSTYYKEKYGENKNPTFEGFMEWVNDPASKIMSKDYTEVEVNGRKAFRLDLKQGSSGNYKYTGYSYMIAADDVLPGSYISISVTFKGDEEITSQKDLDSETQAILDSLTVTANS